MSILDDRILSGPNYFSQGRGETVKIRYYCETKVDYDALVPGEYAEKLTWAQDYTREVARVYEWSAIRIFPGQDYPCWLAVELRTRLPGSHYSTADQLDQSDVVIREYVTRQEYWKMSYFGMKLCTAQDINDVNALGGTLKAFNSCSTEDIPARVGLPIFINAIADTVNWQGSVDTKNSPFGSSLIVTKPENYLNKKIPILLYHVVFYDKINKLDKYTRFSGVNGDFPTKYEPFDTATKAWLVVKAVSVPYFDQNGDEWTKVDRWMAYAPGATKWNNDDTWDWKH